MPFAIPASKAEGGTAGKRVVNEQLGSQTHKNKKDRLATALA